MQIDSDLIIAGLPVIAFFLAVLTLAMVVYLIFDMRQHGMTSIEYIQYRFRGKQIIEDDASKPEVLTKLKDYATSSRWKRTLWLAGLQVTLMFILLWIALFSMGILPPGAALLIPLLGTTIFLFFVGALLDIRMDESVLLIFVAPIMAIVLAIYSTHLFLGAQSLRDTTLTAILGCMIFVACAMPVPLLFAIQLGTGLGNQLLKGTTIRRFMTKGRTLVLVPLLILSIIIIFQLNDQIFPEMDPTMVLVENAFFIALLLALIRVPLDEKLLVSSVACIMAVGVAMLLSIPIHFLLPLIVIAPLLTCLVDQSSNLNITNIRVAALAIPSLFLLPVSLLWYLVVFAISDGAFIFTLLFIGISAAFTAIKLNLGIEEAILISLGLTIGLVTFILVPDLLPRYEQLVVSDEETESAVLGNLVLPLYLLLLFSILWGQKIRQNVLFIANDGHKLANKGERILDDWLSKNEFVHDVHPILAEDLQVSFRVKQGDMEYLLQFWSEVHGTELMVQQHQFKQRIKDQKIKVDSMYKNDLDLLDSRLEYIRRGETRVSTGSGPSF